MKILLLAWGQLALVDFVEDLAQLFEYQLHLLSVLFNLGDAGLLLRSKLGARRILNNLFNFFKIFLEVFPFLCLLVLNHLLLFSLLDTFLIALHDNGHENVLNSGVEEDHKENEIDLPRKALCPGFEEGIIDDISVE